VLLQALQKTLVAKRMSSIEFIAAVVTIGRQQTRTTVEGNNLSRTKWAVSAVTPGFRGDPTDTTIVGY
jgi:hypothetical protein